MGEDGNARDEAGIQIQLAFSELEKGDVIATKGYVTNGQPSLEILFFGMLMCSKRQIHMPLF